MGNEIAKKYDTDEEPTASGGLACLWKIYKGTDKATGQPVSLFVYNKEDLKDVDKALREQVLVILRREIKVLEGMSSRRHPCVVRHIESFEETKKVLAFVTERVACSLADAIGDGPSSLSPPARAAVRRGFERYEIARGLYGLCEGLQFVHTIRRRLHLNLSPESIFLAPSGQFKLGGFGFSVDLPSNGSPSTPCPFFQTGARSGFDGSWRLHPVMAFASPEATAPAGSNDVSCASDMFSLGCLMYQLCRDDPRTSRLVTADATPQAHQTFCATLDYPGRVNIAGLFPEAQSLVTSLLQPSAMSRPTLGNVTINPMFHGTQVTVLKTIDGIPSRNPAEAATFLTSVRPAVGGFPLRVQRDCIMMPLMDACAEEKSGRLWAFALPIVTDVCEKLDRREIIDGVQAKFRSALRAEPVEALGSLIAAIPLFLQKMEVAFFRSDVVPMVCRALQAQGSAQSAEANRRALDVQESSLKAVADEAFHRAIDGRTRELSLLPRICWLVVKGAAVRVKVNALLCLSKTFHFFQVRAVVDKILPTLKFCAERDQTVAIQLCVLGCYDAISKRLDKLGPVATHILPACTPMLACKGLNSTQFEMAVGIVQGMLETVITYRRKEIANPSATAIIDKRPTHAGGEPNEEEIARQRAIVLGGWKPAPSGTPSTSKTEMKASLAGSSMFPPGTSATPAAASAASGPGGFDVADVFGGFSAAAAGSSGVASSSVSLGGAGRALPAAINTSAAVLNGSTVRTAAPSDMFSGMSISQKAPQIRETKLSGQGGAMAAADIFQGLSLSEKSSLNGTAHAQADGAPVDPFASAGAGDPFGSIAGQGAQSATASSSMTWMDDAFGTTAGGPGVPTSGMGVSSAGHAPSSSFGPSKTNFASAGHSGRRAAPTAGILPPPPPTGRTASPAAGTSGADPFAAFFDAAIAGGAGPARSPEMVPAVAPTMPTIGQMGASSTAGFAATSVGGTGGWTTGGGSGGGSIEDELAKTQREIAELTRELGGSAMATSTGLAAVGVGGGVGSAWSMPGSAGRPGSGVGAGSGGSQPLAHQGQGNGGQDPFAFLS